MLWKLTGLGIGILMLAVAGAAWSQEAEEGKEGEGEPAVQEEEGADEEGEKEGDIRKLLQLLGGTAAVKEEFVAGMKFQWPDKDASFWDELITDEDLKGLEDLMIPVYDKEFTHEEIQQWLAFYDTPLGKKLAAKTQVINKGLLGARLAWMMKIGMKIAAKMMEDDEGPLSEVREASNETRAIGALRTIASVQAQFREGDRENDSSLDYATSLAELSQAGLIDNVLGSGKKAGYIFTLSGSTYAWNCKAVPVDEKAGKRSFIVCTDGVVRFSTADEATCESEWIE